MKIPDSLRAKYDNVYTFTTDDINLGEVES